MRNFWLDVSVEHFRRNLDTCGNTSRRICEKKLARKHQHKMEVLFLEVNLAIFFQLEVRFLGTACVGTFAHKLPIIRPKVVLDTSVYFAIYLLDKFPSLSNNRAFANSKLLFWPFAAGVCAALPAFENFCHPEGKSLSLRFPQQCFAVVF